MLHYCMTSVRKIEIWWAVFMPWPKQVFFLLYTCVNSKSVALLLVLSTSQAQYLCEKCDFKGDVIFMKCAKLTFHWKGFTWVYAQNTDITLPLWTSGWGRGWAHCPTYGILARLCGCASLLSFLPPCTCLWHSTWPLTFLKRWRLSTRTKVHSSDQDRHWPWCQEAPDWWGMSLHPCVLLNTPWPVPVPFAQSRGWPSFLPILTSPHMSLSCCSLLLQDLAEEWSLLLETA